MNALSNLDGLPAIKDLPFRCESDDDLLALPEPSWHVHEVIPTGGLVLVFGSSGSGKSFLATDMAYHLALGRPGWFGHDIDRRIRVLYIAAEAGAGVIKRVRAYRQHLEINDLTDCWLTWIRRPIDLLDNRTAEDLVTCWAVLGNPEAVIVDTWSRCMTGNENASEDVCGAIATLDRFRQETGATVIVVHHSPLSDKERPRGHGALFAAADTAISVDQVGDQRVAKLTYQRDGEAGLRFAFKLVPVDMGEDAKGRPISSCIVEQGDVPPDQGKKPQLSARYRRALDVLNNCLADAGDPSPGGAHFPANARVVSLDLWKRNLEQAGVLDGDASNPREDWRRIKNTLADRGYIGIWSEQVWTVF